MNRAIAQKAECAVTASPSAKRCASHGFVSGNELASAMPAMNVKLMAGKKLIPNHLRGS